MSDLQYQSSDTNSVVRRTILERVANSDDHFARMRQRDQEDLSFDDRIEFADRLLTANPGEFLGRFGSLLANDDLAYFDKYSATDYAVNYHIAEIRRRQIPGKTTRAIVKNRRYEAMRRLEANGDYFTDEEMKKRDPLLYEQMVGRYLSNEDAFKMSQDNSTDTDNAKLSDVLLRHLQVIQNNELYAQQKVLQGGQEMEEEDSDVSEEKDDIEEFDEDSDDDNESHRTTNEAHKKSADDHDKAVLRMEFIETMKHRFMNGEDADFDYSEVDNNADYDSIDQLNRDAEEKYFDDDDDDDDDGSQRDDVPSNDIADYDY